MLFASKGLIWPDQTPFYPTTCHPASPIKSEAWDKLSDNQARHTQFRWAYTVIMAEGTAALAHDHGLEAA